MEQISLQEEMEGFDSPLNVIDTPGLPLLEKNHDTSLENDEIYSIISTYADEPESDKENDNDNINNQSVYNIDQKLFKQDNILNQDNENNNTNSNKFNNTIEIPNNDNILLNDTLTLVTSPPISINSEDIISTNKTIENHSIKSLSQPIINPRKESMINLEMNWRSNPHNITNIISQDSNINTRNTKRDGMLSAQRRSSLFYDNINTPYSTVGNISPKDSQFKFPVKNLTLPSPSPSLSPSSPSSIVLTPRQSSKPENIPPHLLITSSTNNNNKVLPPPAITQSPTHTNKKPNSPKKVNSPDSNFFSHLLPGFLNPFSKHSRKLSCPVSLIIWFNNNF
ncbi:hypothetical protein K502DRAFT_162467 [Neoconidiobolus thromboides FSU 785]|nr:hypothetical protein K502DRAFT_162467 [Neoconidiobolus thromboides FSU 785]